MKFREPYKFEKKMMRRMFPSWKPTKLRRRMSLLARMLPSKRRRKSSMNSMKAYRLLISHLV